VKFGTVNLPCSALIAGHLTTVFVSVQQQQQLQYLTHNSLKHNFTVSKLLVVLVSHWQELSTLRVTSWKEKSIMKGAWRARNMENAYNLVLAQTVPKRQIWNLHRLYLSDQFGTCTDCT
jgi:hypothetical protein